MRATHPVSPRSSASPRRYRRGSILVPVALGTCAVAFLAWAGMSVMPEHTASTATAAAKAKKKPIKRDPAPLTNNELAVALTRLGMAADPLSAAGCSGAEVATVVGNGRTYLNDHIQDLRDADVAWGNARGDVDRLTRLVQGGQSGNVEALNTAQTTFETANSQRNAVFAAISSAALNGLDGGKAAILATIHTNNGAWDMPTQYLAGAFSEPDWVHLRDALANDRISAAEQVDPDPNSHAFLTTANEMPAISAAAGNLASVADARAAWNAAVYP